MTDENIITKNHMIQDSTYDRLAAWGRRWLPLAAVFFIALSGAFMGAEPGPGPRRRRTVDGHHWRHPCGCVRWDQRIPEGAKEPLG